MSTTLLSQRFNYLRSLKVEEDRKAKKQTALTQKGGTQCELAVLQRSGALRRIGENP